MFPNIPAQQGSKDERKLIRLFKSLSDADKAALMRFAEFLEGSTISDGGLAEIGEPVSIPRPEEESVIKAIKRLTKTYPMVDKDKMFNTTSTLMSAHVMQGRSASDVIDELEVAFKEQYDLLVNPVNSEEQE